MTILPLNEIIKIMYRHCVEKYSEFVEVKFNHKVVHVGQDEHKAWADVQVDGAADLVRLEADYVIGCDGGRSVVRHELFGREWPGMTHDCHLLVQNVSHLLPCGTSG
jgi:2-polyprenyl-6-methoxyphenol hydroxylase-like FAD-dependent oxidoreductase